MQADQLLDAVRRLAGFEQIRGCIYRCARALDRLDRELLSAQFWPDGHIEYGSIYRGPVPGFVEVAMQFQGSMRDTQHLVGNPLIEIDGANACAESYVHAHHVIEEPEGLIELVVGGRYLDRFERRGDEWRIVYRTEVLDWGRRSVLLGGWFEASDALPKARRDRGDLSYELLSARGEA